MGKTNMASCLGGLTGRPSLFTAASPSVGIGWPARRELGRCEKGDGDKGDVRCQDEIGWRVERWRRRTMSGPLIGCVDDAGPQVRSSGSGQGGFCGPALPASWHLLSAQNPAAVIEHPTLPNGMEYRYHLFTS